jgi:hypothetical protein
LDIIKNSSAEELTPDYRVNAIKLCTDEQTGILKGMQTEISESIGTEYLDPIMLTAIGDTTGDCELFEVVPGVGIPEVSIVYDASTIRQISLLSSKGDSIKVGLGT